MVKLPELLAPASNLLCIEAALLHGADAVYVGIGEFNLRANADNITEHDMKNALDMVHAPGKKLYLALNSMPGNSQLARMRDMLSTLALQKTLPDACIVSDPGVIAICKEIIPSVELHLSTQTGTFNSAAMQFWKAAGVTRAVLPREMTLAQIDEFSHAGIMETEVFIHGAMCMSISGRCLLGAYLGKRHPNHGNCPQPCRWSYSLTLNNPADTGLDQGIDIIEEDGNAYLMNSKDLCTIELLDKIVATGVTSLKIEGRNRSISYVSSVVKAYRAALDSLNNSGTFPWTPPAASVVELNAVDHRPYTTGFYQNEYNLQDPHARKELSTLPVVGIIRQILSDGRPIIEVKNNFAENDTLSVLPVRQGFDAFNITVHDIRDLTGKSHARATANRFMTILTPENGQMRPGDLLRKSTLAS